MKEDIGKRIEELLRYYSMSKAELTRKIGLNNNVTVSRICLGQVKPSYEMILKILEAFPEVKGSWLISGEGTMLKDAPILSDEIKRSDEVFEYQKWLINHLSQELAEKRKDCNSLKEELVSLKQSTKKKEPNPEDQA